MERNEFYEAIANKISKEKQNHKPLLVGINGVDTSGKSTFTKELVKYLSELGFKTQIIFMDDFHNPSQVRNSGKDPINSYLNNAFNLEKIENELLKSISLGGKVDKELLLLNLENDEYDITKRYIIDKETIVLFEGVLLYREPLDKYFDLRIFIDISFDEVLKRARKRDTDLFGDRVIQRYKEKYIPVQKIYLEKFTPKEKSNIIIDNEKYMNPNIIKVN
ncbi:hypothetical protein [Oceanirhabdus sp. W0125-5]|uniref:hypothetical protein n=1 Tax=Oceanirhabdus sp. W0125-5 TaxID=2999116 RepID=UPI0022F2BAED|nr:hypothetical protein [Oceanirhabdus sp. W0125-5]WBW94937.1 hypothetical protein OW730_14660 [Oceanirhabdus sp. W0125-5]